MNFPGRGYKVVPILAAFAALLFAAPAMGAADRFAAVGGDGAFPCAFADPCSLEQAISTAESGDIVYPLSGTYNVTTTLELPPGAGIDAGSGAIINSTATVGIRVVAASSTSYVRDVTLNHNPSSGSPANGLELLSGWAFHNTITSTGNNACVVTGMISTARLTDSICHHTALSPGVAVTSYSAVDSTAGIYGVTAISDNGYGLFVNATAPNAHVNLIGANVIAQGGLVDQTGFNSSTTSTSSSISLSYSNFDTLDFTSPTGSTGTLPTVNNNVSAPALLDANFRQLPGSPTINAGGTFAEQVFTDIDGETHGNGGATDIGADEAEGEAPNTAIDSKPPKRTRKTTARFTFSSTDLGEVTFECKIDAKAFKPCTSGIKFQNLKRGKRHTFQVRSTDGFFNTDPTPAKYSWKVLKKR